MDKQSLDNLFKNKLQRYERKPNADAWDKLEFLLDEKAAATKKNRKIGVIWLSVAASVCILLLGWWTLLPSSQQGEGFNTPALSQDKDSTGEYEQQNFALEEDSEHQETQPNSLEEPVPHPSKVTRSLQKTEIVKTNTTNTVKQKHPDDKNIEESHQEDPIPEKFRIPEEDINQENTGIAQTEKRSKGYKIVVKVKFKDAKKIDKPVVEDNSLYAQVDEPGKSRKKRKLFKKNKNNKKDKEFKILGIDPEKVWASLGK